MVFYCIFWTGQFRTVSCKYKTMTSLPKYGVLLTPKYVKNAILEGYAATLRGVIILPPSQRRFLARLPRWQLQPYGKLSTRQCRKAAQCFK